MIRIAVVRIALCAVVGLLAFPRGSNAARPGGKAKPPNIVVIFVDDMGYGDLGCFGAKKIKTPNLDRMAKQGIRFTDFYVAQPVCSASRAAILTGRYPNRVGILGALGPASKNGLGKQDRTIAELLKTLGYATAIFGKWHLGHQPEHLPTRHGFDEYFGLPYSNDMWPKHPTNKTFPDLPLIQGEKTIAHNPDQSKLTTWYTEKAVDFITRNKDRPFFLYLAHNMPHVPLFVSDRFKGKSEQGLYGDVVMELDWSVGQILETLQRLGLDENTLVIFTSDNGPWLSYGNHAGSAGPLREGKATIWEGGVRVPFIARWTGRIPAGSTCREPAMTIDLLPTFAKLTGAKIPPHKIDGKDIWPLLSGQPGAKSPQEAYYFYWGRHLQGVRSGQWKLHFPHTYPTLAGGPGGKDGKPAPYKQAKAGLELYDLANDVGETVNAAAKHPEVVKRLQALADRARADLGDVLPKEKGKAGAAAGGQGWIDLMPVADLKGWKRVPIPPDKKLAAKNPWKLADDGKTLICDGVGVKEMLLYDREWKDGVFHVEWRFKKVAGEPEYNSGVYVRTAADASVWVQAQVAHTKKPPHLGDLFADLLADGKTTRVVVEGSGLKHARPPGEWNTYDVTCKGKTITVSVNGKDATTWNDCPILTGRVGLQAEFFYIEFKNLKFKALD